MYRLIATIYEKGILIGYKITNRYVDEEVSIEEAHLLAMSGLIINVEAGANKSLIGRHGFDIRTITRIDKDFGEAPAFYEISSYIVKNSNKAANMMFKPDLIIKQAISSINRDKEKDVYTIVDERNDIIVEKMVYDIDKSYFYKLINKNTDKHIKDKYTEMLKRKSSEIDIKELEKLILKSFGYEVLSDEEMESSDKMLDILIKERKVYRVVTGYEIVNCGIDSIQYKKHDIKNNIADKEELNAGESKAITEYDLKLLMAKEGFNGCIGNANLGFTPMELNIKDGKTLVNKCIKIKLQDDSIVNRQVYIGELKKIEKENNKDE